jgi:hypothetical protein
MAISNTIEELVFELAEEYTSGDLEKLIKLLDIVINGVKSREPQQDSEPVKASTMSTPKTKSSKALGVESTTEEEPF